MNMSTQKYVQMGVLALLYHMLGIFSIIEGTITVHDLMEPKKHETFEHFCEIETDSAWCIPENYDKELGPWRFRHLTNSRLPWHYFFDYTIHDIHEVNDQKQTVTFDMYFKIKWYEPRVHINTTSVKWIEQALMIDEEYYLSLPLEYMDKLWVPDSEIYALDQYKLHNVLRPLASFRVNEEKLMRYLARVKVVVSCQMNFENYPFDSQTCDYRQGSFYNTKDVVDCNATYSYEKRKQRHLQYTVKIVDLPPDHRPYEIFGQQWATCGFQMVFERSKTQIFCQVYLPCALLVIVSMVSFVVNPTVVPGRMGMLVVVLLVLMNIFMSVKATAPHSSGFLNLVDIFLAACVLHVFVAFLEYAMVLIGIGQHKKGKIINKPKPLPSVITINGSKIENKQNGLEINHKSKDSEDSLDTWIQLFWKKWMAKMPNYLGSDMKINKLDSVFLILYPISFATFLLSYFTLYL